MGKQYGHLSLEERAVIQAKLDEGCGVRQISQSLGRAPSTISRELNRCGWAGPKVVRYMPSWRDGVNGYNCELAHRRARRLASTRSAMLSASRPSSPPLLACKK